MEMSKEYIDNWKQAIYQKTDRIDFSFWYGNEENRGKKRDMEDEERKGNSGIMKFPIIWENGLMNVIKNMKNGKAAGVDGVSAELMKHITKNEDIKSTC